MKRLLYSNSKVLIITRGANDIARKLSMNYNRDFLDYHNNICPCCQKEMKVEKHSNEVKQVGSVIVGIFEDLNVVVPYVICKPCTRLTPVQQKAKIDQAEEYVIGQLGLEDKLTN